jgi:Sec-independent protein translocase protein TatA
MGSVGMPELLVILAIALIAILWLMFRERIE